MKLSPPVLASLLSLSLAPLASAQYFSAGWAPGQPVPTLPSTPPPPSHQSPQSPLAPPAPPAPKPSLPSLTELSDKFSLQNILSSRPVSALFDKAGINITERLANAQVNQFWDKRIPLITDENWEEVIVNEELTEEEERERVWFILMCVLVLLPSLLKYLTSSSLSLPFFLLRFVFFSVADYGNPHRTVTAATPNGVSKYADEMFDQAYNLTQIAGDLPEVRWGRIDYINVTAITTRWGVWQYVSSPYSLLPSLPSSIHLSPPLPT